MIYNNKKLCYKSAEELRRNWLVDKNVYNPNPNQDSIHIGVRAIFCQGGGKLFAQKIPPSCPNFYETVEKKRGPYDATTWAVLAYEGGSIL